MRLRRASRFSLRYRAFHLSAVLSKTFLIVSLLMFNPLLSFMVLKYHNFFRFARKNFNYFIIIFGMVPA